MSVLLQHEMIKASAGSGKTYALVNRYLRLLALGVEPGRITALTFTRKAAGEFLGNIFMRLTEAASCEKAATRLSENLGLKGKDCAFFRKLLSGLVKEIGRLQLGTIDHFFGRIVGAFPYELGLARPHRVMDDFEKDVARERVLRQLVETGDGENDALILQLYKNLTWGTDDKNVFRVFDENLKDYHHVYIDTDDASLWGNDGLIFGDTRWWEDGPESPDEAIRQIESQLELAGMKKAMIGAFQKLLDNFRDWQPGQDINGGTILKRMLEAREDLPKGTASISFNRSAADIPAQMGKPLYQLLQYFVRAEIRRSILVAKSLGQFLATYDAGYAQLIRETGSLVFSDLPMLLAKAFARDASVMSGEDLVYRLDSRTDHWLLDEFQDTSRIQWKVLSRFVEEVLQDPEGQRSFFYVGDVKQSIYAWRGGDPRLFDEIYNYYTGKNAGIRKTDLLTSWRSAPPVLDCVNRLFGGGLEHAPLPPAVLERWRRDWGNHRPSPVTASLSGHAAWGLVEEEASTEEACIELLRKTAPLERGLSCAILLRDNSSVRSMTQALRDAGIAASMEAQVHIAMDNVVGSWIRALLYSMARPGEAFPRQYIGMTGAPLSEARHKDLLRSVREALTGEGYAEAVRRILDELNDLVAEQPFLRHRSEQLLEAAVRFRGSGQDSLEHFITYLEKATVAETTIHTQVQVMTVHKAKGLDFDMVIVAGFGPGEVVRSGSRNLHIERNPDGEVDWILEMPRKQVVESDPCLSAAWTSCQDDQYYESLCILYVAMTRARRGLYCIANSYTGSGEVLRWHHLLEAAFRGQGTPEQEGFITWQCKWGTADWYLETDRKEDRRPVFIELPVMEEALPRETEFLRHEASPSREAHTGVREFHRLGSIRGKQFGTRMHAFLATIEWIAFDDKEALEQSIDTAPDDLRDRFSGFLRTPQTREVFQRPNRPCRLWREKPYALREGNILTQGIIDRAIVFLDKDDQPEEVMIFDYKTDKLDPNRPAEEQLQERYSHQLDRYVEAVAVLTGLEKGHISTRLVPV